MSVASSCVPFCGELMHMCPLFPLREERGNAVGHSGYSVHWLICKISLGCLKRAIHCTGSD